MICVEIDVADPFAAELHVEEEEERIVERPLVGVAAVRLRIAERVLAVHRPDELRGRDLHAVHVPVAVDDRRLAVVLGVFRVLFVERPARVDGLVDECVAVQPLHDVDLAVPRPAASLGVLVD